MSDDVDFLDDLDEIQDDGPDYVPESTCDICAGVFGPADTGHCRGGKWGGCCQTFASDNAFVRHRTGKYEPDTRRCLTTDELLAKGWAQSGPYGSWRTPAPANSPWRKKEQQ